jgi:hypothetical protein
MLGWEEKGVQSWKGVPYSITPNLGSSHVEATIRKQSSWCIAVPQCTGDIAAVVNFGAAKIKRGHGM